MERKYCQGNITNILQFKFVPYYLGQSISKLLSITFLWIQAIQALYLDFQQSLPKTTVMVIDRAADGCVT